MMNRKIAAVDCVAQQCEEERPVVSIGPGGRE